MASELSLAAVPKAAAPKLTAELRFARVLASNDKKTRTQAVKRVRAWLANRKLAHTELDMTKLWKGLFYCMWMADKRPVQHELARKLADITSCISNDCDGATPTDIPSSIFLSSQPSPLPVPPLFPPCLCDATLARSRALPAPS